MTDEPAPASERERMRELAHTLRTPIAVIQGFAELLGREGDLSEEERQKYAARIRAGAAELREALDAHMAQFRDE